MLKEERGTLTSMIQGIDPIFPIFEIKPPKYQL